MYKILIITNFDVGLYNFRRELLAELVKKYEVHIALPDGEFIPNLKEMGCIFHETKLERRGMNPMEELRLMRTYEQIIRRVHPDVVLTYTIKPNIYAGMICSRRRIPFITNITGLGTAMEGKGILQKVMCLMYRHAMRGVSCLFFQNTANEFFFRKKGIGIGKHAMLPGSGVNLTRFPYLEYPPEDAPVEFLFISRVMKEKGIDQYLEMAKVIKKKYPDTVFRILGFCEDDDEKPDSYRNRIRELEEQGIVSFEGMQKEIQPFLQKSQCTIHPSYYPEGMSNVCLESAASGRPVITTRRPGCEDAVEDGVTGLLVYACDTDDLIRAVEKFLQMPYEERKQLGINARDKMEIEFDRRIVVDRYKLALQRIIQKGEEK